MKHQQANVIHAFADGAAVECSTYQVNWFPVGIPLFEPGRLYRIAPVQPAGADGWIPHFGQCAVPTNAEVKRRNGEIGTVNEGAFRFLWTYDDTGPIDAIAYRTRKPVEKWQWWVLYRQNSSTKALAQVFAQKSAPCASKKEAIEDVNKWPHAIETLAAYRIEESRVVE